MAYPRSSPKSSSKRSRRWSGAQVATHGLAIVLGILFTLSTLAVLPSQAEAVTPQSATVLAQLPPQSVSGQESFVARAVKQIGGAVVRIDTERTIVRAADPFFDDPFFRRFFGDDFSSRLPREQLQRGQGSGFIVDADGIVLTNAHVVDQADRVTVTLKDGRQFEGQVKGADQVTDLAVVQINSNNTPLPVARLGDSDAVEVGDWAIAVGNPLGLDNTVTLGIVSTLGRSSSEVGIPDKRLEFIQTDAAINPGNSGGPLLNAQGEVIGINTAIRADANGIGFAIPVNKAKSIEAQLLKTGKVSHPYLGVQMVSLTPDMARSNNADPNSTLMLPETEGVLIVRVIPRSPADQAGLRRGDVITQVEGQPITTAAKLQTAVENSQVGQVLQLTVLRSGTTQQIGVRTAELNESSLR
ncbi:MAG: HhoA/HhoB/HtrA family serine endopeptidase [Prochlorotrichaceae cyanobacterium]|jgi:Do/DeqQ family serine protease